MQEMYDLSCNKVIVNMLLIFIHTYSIIYHLRILFIQFVDQSDKNWLIYANKQSKYIISADMQEMYALSCNEAIVNIYLIFIHTYSIMYHLRILFI
jgi:hypothetical protein